MKRQFSYIARKNSRIDAGSSLLLKEDKSSPTSTDDGINLLIHYNILLYILLIQLIIWLKGCDETPGIIAHVLTVISLLLICITFPISLCYVVKVVQEYERAVVFRLGRMLTGKARGPGVFFVIPCIDMYEKIDLRTQSYDVPPQEVKLMIRISYNSPLVSFPYQNNL